jgi:undecaprenyl-diphosphatase
MPLLVLLLIAALAGVLIALAFARLAPAEGAATAIADAVGEAAEASAPRTWWQVRTDPAVATGLALTAAVATIAIAGVVISALALVVRGNTTGIALDSWAATWGNEHATDFSTRAIGWITDLGTWPVVPFAGIAIVIYERWRVPNRLLVPFLTVVILGNLLITASIKDLIDRARPTLNPIAQTLGPSFPSGHTSAAAAFYAALALILARGRTPRVRSLLAGAAGAIAVAVALSRVLLDVHWVSDVIAGLLLGWAWFAVCAIAFGSRRLQLHRGPEPDPAGRTAADRERPRAGFSA